MRNIVCIAALGLLAASALRAEVYRWVDADGIVHYSDQAHAGAEEVVLPDSPPPPTSPHPSASLQRTLPTNGGDERRTSVGYDRLTVASPAAEETLWNVGGTLNVSLSLSPALRPGDRVRVYFDGEAQMVSGLQFELQEVYRGAHSLQAEVIDEAGKLLIRSQPSRFYIQQTSIVNPH